MPHQVIKRTIHHYISLLMNLPSEEVPFMSKRMDGFPVSTLSRFDLARPPNRRPAQGPVKTNRALLDVLPQRVLSYGICKEASEGVGKKQLSEVGPPNSSASSSTGPRRVTPQPVFGGSWAFMLTDALVSMAHSVTWLSPRRKSFSGPLRGGHLNAKSKKCRSSNLHACEESDALISGKD